VSRALVTGATGFIGGRLAGALGARGWEVRCLVRDRTRAGGLAAQGFELHEGDVLDSGSLRGAGEGIDVAYYLIHAMGRGGKSDFAERERLAATNFAVMAAREGIGRIIYLGGLGDNPKSEHLLSRRRTAEILAELGPPLTYFRAGMVVGAGGESYRTLRYLVQRLPAMIAPAWLATPTQPIAIDDVIAYLSQAPAVESSQGREVQIGGPDILSYGEMLDRMADAMGVRRRPRLPVPLITPWLSSLWIGLVTPVDSKIARPLIEGLSTPTTVTDASLASQFDVSPTPFLAALRKALAEESRVRLLPEQMQRVPRTGSVGSIERAEIRLPAAEPILSQDFLHRAAREYWRFVSRASLGLIRVVYARDHQSVILLARPLQLLRFRSPDYELGEQRGSVTWQIERGLLVSSQGRGQGFLRMSIERIEDAAAGDRIAHRVSMEVQNFYPWLRGGGSFARVGTWLYSQTQLRIHRWVTKGFLRSLASLDLPPSEIGSLHAEIDAT
jgi:uncharacterized protein YbjT (DUF2867 family)